MILVVHDAENAQQRISHVLSWRGHTTAQAAGVSEALRLLDEFAPRPRLVVLDWVMPDLSGLETLRLIRSDPKFADLPVVVCHDQLDEQKRDAALAAGAQACVAKDAPGFEDLCHVADRYDRTIHIKVH
jgi:CheY-like chemotaxis protein